MPPFDDPVSFPARPAPGDTALVLVPNPDGEGLPVVRWLGTAAGPGADDHTGRGMASWAADVDAAAGPAPGTPLLVEHAGGSYRRPSLRGSRLSGGQADTPAAGRDWSTRFILDSLDIDARRLVVSATDRTAALGLRVEIESVPGGALRLRHTVTNAGTAPYLLVGLDICVPLGDHADEILDFTGRHERERTPQRQPVRDGLWLRENRRGRTGLESATMIVAGPAGFGFATGELVAVHVAHSGNSTLWAERDPAGPATVGGGELLLPGEMVLAPGDSYATPWVFVVAGTGLDAIAATFHGWSRSLPTHPAGQPVLLNVWEAVYFDHDLDRLTRLADQAARIGVERFVLDDGWFAGRRDDSSGLGDWWVDEQVWPGGLHPIINRVRELGMQFGLWFEPEMVNPDSQLYRAHPDWILASGGRRPHLVRHQLVLDLTNREVQALVLDRMDALLSMYPVDYVKWDHNRDLLEPGDQVRGVPVAHRQTEAYYDLLDTLRRRHPNIEWESCASGGGRIDLGVLDRVQRVWTSDMTDALSRQQIQRWTAQLVAPEYLGAHISATTSHQTGRTLPLDFRAATALFGSFGLEWDLSQASECELEQLAEWVARYKRFRPLVHSGRLVRIDVAEATVLVHGVIAQDRRSALLAHVQLDEAASNRAVTVRIPGLVPDQLYDLHWEGPIDQHPMSQSPPVDPAGPTGGRPVHGAVLGHAGIAIPRRRPETVLLIHIEAHPS